MFGRKRRAEGHRLLMGRKNATIATYLAGKFDFEESTYDLLVKSLNNSEGSTNGHFEFILDNPMAASFRLKKDRDGNLRVAYYPTIPPGNPEREERAQELTEAVQKIAAWFA